MSLQKIVEFYMKRDLSGEEIVKLIGKEVVLYSDLKNYKTIDQLLGKENYVVILYQTSSITTGHFVAITRNEKTGKVRYNDSYGLDPLTELQYTAFDKPLPRYLIDLLQNVPYETNRVDYQSRKAGVSTCGRYASLFCLFQNFTLQELGEIFTKNATPYLNVADNSVTLLTLVALKDIRDFVLQ